MAMPRMARMEATMGQVRPLRCDSSKEELLEEEAEEVEEMMMTMTQGTIEVVTTGVMIDTQETIVADLLGETAGDVEMGMAVPTRRVEEDLAILERTPAEMAMVEEEVVTPLTLTILETTPGQMTKIHLEIHLETSHRICLGTSSPGCSQPCMSTITTRPAIATSKMLSLPKLGVVSIS